MSKVIKSGSTQITYSQDQTAFFTSFLKKLAPETAQILESTVQDLEAEAKKNWPVRHTSRDRSEEERLAVSQQAKRLQQSGYSRVRARAASENMLKRNRLNVRQLSEAERQDLRESKSKRSIDKFKTSITISPSGMVDASVSNMAEYAWAIKMGLDSKTSGGSPIFLPLGSRISNELLWKPAKKQARKIAAVVADEITRIIDRG